MLRYQLEPEIYNFRTLYKFNQAIQSSQELAYPIHIKFETGMNRLGFQLNDLDKLIAELKQMPNIKVQSVFSHLAGSDEPIHDDFTKYQIGALIESSDRLSSVLGYPVIRHILNSSGIERFPSAQMEMVRLGIGIYGVSNTNQEKLMHVGTLKTIVSQIRKVRKGDTIGYSRNGTVKKDGAIAILPIGYADGYNRKLGNGRGKVFLNNKFVPTIGNICMDMCMIDITGIDVHEGDEVILFGEELPITTLAEQLDTIPYEILTSISNRVNRIYFKE
jgi:alanine racemase